MLDPGRIDLSSLAEALEDHSDETSWWFDPRTGEVEPWSEYLSSEEDEIHPEDRGLIPVEPIPSSEGYADMEDFIASVRDPRPRDLLQRAIQGRGAFRRFKDTLLELPELRAAWFAFHDARAERRALEWLLLEGIIDPAVAEVELRARPDPATPGPAEAVDPDRIAQEVAEDLEGLYGGRLRGIILFGSWARGDAHPESDIDLLVVLDRVASAWEELRRMEPIVWSRSFAHDTVVTVTPVAEADLASGRWPLLVRAQAEGRRVA